MHIHGTPDGFSCHFQASVECVVGVRGAFDTWCCRSWSPVSHAKRADGIEQHGAAEDQLNDAAPRDGRSEAISNQGISTA